ncbi:MAG: MarR family winged helix-turn-helix transcriptional regulator [Salinarimonas sp.]
MTRRVDVAEGGTRGEVRSDELSGPAPLPAGAADDPGFRLDTQVGHLIRRAHQRNTEIFNTMMGRFAVTPTQFAALVTLLDRGATPQNRLGRLTAMDPATIFGVVGRLMKRGYVRQSPVSADARLVAVSLTPEGEAAARAMRAAAQEVSTRTLAPLSEEEARSFLALLARLG